MGNSKSTDENPYQSGIVPTKTPTTRPTLWLIWSGVASIVLAALCFAIAVVGMRAGFDRVARSGGTPQPEELAESLSRAMSTSLGGVSFVILGIVLLIAGFVVRKPIG